MTRTEKIETTLINVLKKHNINYLPDWEHRHDGEFLDNIVFEKDGKSKKIYRPHLLREGGQSHFLEKSGNDFKLSPLTDVIWIKTYTENLIKFFNNET